MFLFTDKGSAAHKPTGNHVRGFIQPYPCTVGPMVCYFYTDHHFEI